jgi:hypothetical protein
MLENLFTIQLYEFFETVVVWLPLWRFAVFQTDRMKYLVIVLLCAASAFGLEAEEKPE